MHRYVVRTRKCDDPLPGEAPAEAEAGGRGLHRVTTASPSARPSGDETTIAKRFGVERYGRFVRLGSASRSRSAPPTSPNGPGDPLPKRVTTQGLAEDAAASPIPEQGAAIVQDRGREAQPGDRAAALRPGRARMRHRARTWPRSRRSSCRATITVTQLAGRTSGTSTSARPPGSTPVTLVCFRFECGQGDRRHRALPDRSSLDPRDGRRVRVPARARATPLGHAPRPP